MNADELEDSFEGLLRQREHFFVEGIDVDDADQPAIGFDDGKGEEPSIDEIFGRDQHRRPRRYGDDFRDHHIGDA